MNPHSTSLRVGRLGSSFRSLLLTALVPCVTVMAACGAEEESVDEHDSIDDAGHAADGSIHDDTGLDAGSTTYLTSRDNLYDRSSGFVQGVDAGLDAGENTGSSEPGEGRGDIYRLFPDSQWMLHLSEVRGLQILDIGNPDAPVILGTFTISGAPVEVHVVDSTAYVLLNDSIAWAANPEDARATYRVGGVVVAIDITDPTQPRELARAMVDGSFVTSHLLETETQQRLFIASNSRGLVEPLPGRPPGENAGVIQSFDVTGGAFVERDTLALPGIITDTKLNGDTLLVAGRDPYAAGEPHGITLLGISQGDGTLERGDTVSVMGAIESSQHMHLRDELLQVVSTVGYGDESTTHIETFEAAGVTDLTPLGARETTAGATATASAFVDGRILVATEGRTNSLYDFAVAENGEIEERGRIEIADTIEHLRPVLDDARLIGIGFVEEPRATQITVSLFDTGLVDEASTLIASTAVPATEAWSEAIADGRAFTLQEDAVNAVSPDGSTETGLLLLPFSRGGRYASNPDSAVELFTWSAETITHRSTLEQGTRALRSFQVDTALTAALSAQELTLFDTTDPSSPEERARVSLSPSYTGLYFFDEYAVRIRDRLLSYPAWQNTQALAPSSIEIVPADSHLDTANPVATVDIVGGASVARVGDYLFAVSVERPPSEGPGSNIAFETTIQPIDLSSPAAPVVLPPFVDATLPGPQAFATECFFCEWAGFHGWRAALVTDTALVFVDSMYNVEPVGTEEVCNVQSLNEFDCRDNPACSAWVVGSRLCRSINDAPEFCEGEFARCTRSTLGEVACVPTEPLESEVSRECYTWEAREEWYTMSLTPVDIRNPSRLQVGPTISFDNELNVVDARVLDGRLLITSNTPVTLTDDPRPWWKYTVQELDVSDPMNPTLGPAIPIPGEPFHLVEDTLYTTNAVWGEYKSDTVVTRLRLSDSEATELASRQFTTDYVRYVSVDDEGRIIVDQESAPRIWERHDTAARYFLTILDAETLEETGRIEHQYDEVIAQVLHGRALFVVPGGMLVMNIENPALPTVQAFLPARDWWIHTTVRDESLIFAAGPYGIYELDLDTVNLLPPW